MSSLAPTQPEVLVAARSRRYRAARSPHPPAQQVERRAALREARAWGQATLRGARGVEPAAQLPSRLVLWHADDANPTISQTEETMRRDATNCCRVHRLIHVPALEQIQERTSSPILQRKAQQDPEGVRGRNTKAFHSLRPAPFGLFAHRSGASSSFTCERTLHAPHTAHKHGAHLKSQHRHEVIRVARGGGFR